MTKKELICKVKHLEEELSNQREILNFIADFGSFGARIFETHWNGNVKYCIEYYYGGRLKQYDTGLTPIEFIELTSEYIVFSTDKRIFKLKKSENVAVDVTEPVLFRNNKGDKNAI